MQRVLLRTLSSPSSRSLQNSQPFGSSSVLVFKSLPRCHIPPNQTFPQVSCCRNYTAATSQEFISSGLRKLKVQQRLQLHRYATFVYQMRKQKELEQKAFLQGTTLTSPMDLRILTEPTVSPAAVVKVLQRRRTSAMQDQPQEDLRYSIIDSNVDLKALLENTEHRSRRRMPRSRGLARNYNRVKRAGGAAADQRLSSKSKKPTKDASVGLTSRPKSDAVTPGSIQKTITVVQKSTGPLLKQAAATC